jgi:hypothetical protein
LRTVAVYLGLLGLSVAAAGCLGAPEADQLRALNDELQRKNVELTVQKLKLKAEVDRLRAENSKLKLQRTAGKTP